MANRPGALKFRFSRPSDQTWLAQKQRPALPPTCPTFLHGPGISAAAGSSRSAARASTISRTSISTIPRDKLVVFTGLSGSGKSSLAFDTIYAEGQRRYVESLSAYARQFLEMMQKPDVDQIDGLSPAISIEQKTTRRTRARPSARSPRSTIICACSGRASASPIRLPPACRSRARPSARWSTASWPCPRARGSICSRRSCAAARANTARNSPSSRRRASSALKIDGEFYEIAEAPTLDKKLKHDIDVVVDRIVVRPDIAARLADTFETALELADGIAIVEFADKRSSSADCQKAATAKAPTRIDLSSEKFACPVSGFTIPEIEPRLFSFNNPFGACPRLRRPRLGAEGRPRCLSCRTS